MAIIDKAGEGFKSKLYVGTKHTNVDGLTLAAMKTFIDTATTTSTKLVANVNGIPGIGDAPAFAEQENLGSGYSTRYRVQKTPSTINFSMDLDPSDAGQALILSAGGGNDIGFVAEMIGAGDGVRLKSLNSFVDIVEDMVTGVLTANVTLSLTSGINTKDDV